MQNFPKFYPYDQPIHVDMLEVVDSNDKPILIQPYKYAKDLAHKNISIILQNTQGKLLLWPYGKELDRKWEILSHFVRAGQSKELTALELLEKSLASLTINMRKENLQQIIENAKCISGATLKVKTQGIKNPIQEKEENKSALAHDELHHTTFYIVKITKDEKMFSHKNLLWLDYDELNGFATHFEDMLSEKTLKLIQQGSLARLREIMLKS